VDIPITAVGGLAALSRAFLKDKFARISCPCDSAGLNFIDRGSVSGKNSHGASDAAMARNTHPAGSQGAMIFFNG
jgi:hypothetical protein